MKEEPWWGQFQQALDLSKLETEIESIEGKEIADANITLVVERKMFEKDVKSVAENFYDAKAWCLIYDAKRIVDILGRNIAISYVDLCPGDTRIHYKLEAKHDHRQ